MLIWYNTYILYRKPERFHQPHPLSSSRYHICNLPSDNEGERHNQNSQRAEEVCPGHVIAADVVIGVHPVEEQTLLNSSL